MNKTCNKCKEAKPNEDFSKDKNKYDGLSTICKPCKAEYRKQYYWNDPDKYRQQTSEWRVNNKDKHNASNRRWRNNNPDKQKEAIKRWGERNPERCRFYSYKRMESVKKATPSWVDWDEIKYIYRLATEKGLSVDHIVPINSKYVCGLHTGDNLRCIPIKLNSYKGNRYWPDMPDDLREEAKNE